jgi:hypothetical protein
VERDGYALAVRRIRLRKPALGRLATDGPGPDLTGAHSRDQGPHGSVADGSNPPT